MQIVQSDMQSRVVAAARGWVGTPYHHQGCVKGIGADCLGLVRGVWREVYGYDAEIPPAYTRDWAEANGHETMLAGAERHLRSVSASEMQAGDVLIFRLRDGTVAKHAAILTSADTFVHAMEGCQASEVPMTRWWRRRIAAVFRFPARTNAITTGG